LRDDKINFDCRGAWSRKGACYLRVYKVVVVLKLQLREEKWKN
jgi:hypothetical protein